MSSTPFGVDLCGSSVAQTLQHARHLKAYFSSLQGTAPTSSAMGKLTEQFDSADKELNEMVDKFTLLNQTYLQTIVA